MADAIENFRQGLKGLTTAELVQLIAKLKATASPALEELAVLQEHIHLHLLIHAPRNDFGLAVSTLPN